MSEVTFKERKTVYQVEEEKDLAPKFDENGLIPVVTTDFTSGELLMHGYMNVEAFKKPLNWAKRCIIAEVVKFYGIKALHPVSLKS